MLPFFYEQENKKKRKETFIHEYAYIEDIPWEQRQEELEQQPKEKRGIIIIDL